MLPIKCIKNYNYYLISILEFRKAFCKCHDEDVDEFKMSSLMVWVRCQMSKFLDRIEKQVFSPSTPLETIAVSVEGIRKQCARYGFKIKCK